MRGIIARLRSLWHGAIRPAQVDAGMADEMRFHIEMETQRLIARGLEPVEARRQAALAFGGVEKYRGEARDALGFTWMRGLSVDVKLGVRMLGKHPGLTAVALFALSLAIGAGAGYLEFVNDLLHGKLPFPEADRIVGIQSWDQQTSEPENRVAFEFRRWRGTLATIDDLGAYQNLQRNLITDDGRAEPVRGAAISSVAFRIAQVPPLHGRPLLEDDERAAAPPVAVIGYDLWTGRFGSDPSAIGRTIRLGADSYTIVGVMPQGFGFPISHSLWVPLRFENAADARRAGAALKVFGRLAPGATLPQAQAELSSIAKRTANEFPDTHRHVHPIVKPYVESLWSGNEDSDMQTVVLYGANLFFIVLLAVCGANVATLVFARTATRETEISVRTALGASRARIAGQLFAEALVLSSIAATVGLTVAYFALKWVKDTVTVAQGNRMMFWWNDSFALETLVYAAALACFAAILVGVVPALKATGPRVQARLKHASGGSAAGLTVGGIWTGIIVAQVGLTVVLLSVVGTLGWGLYFQNGGNRELRVPAHEYIVARLNFDRDSSTEAPTEDEQRRYRQRLRLMYDEFAGRLRTENRVRSVTYASRLPAMNHLELPVQVEGVTGHDLPGGSTFVRTTSIDVRYFDAFPTRLVAGRYFTDADLLPGRHAAIVDESFVRHVLGGGNAVGRRFRKVPGTREDPLGRQSIVIDARGTTEPWVEIVGVVRDLTSDGYKKAHDAVIYRPIAPDDALPLHVAIRVAGTPETMMWRLRVLAAEVDPSLRLDELNTLDQLSVSDRVAIDFFLRLLAGIGVVALVLATAGVYALTSFTVARRSTEIGIRVALGASARRIVTTTFARTLAQVTAGVIAGSVPGFALAASLGPEVAVSADGVTAAIIGGIAAGATVAITALACVGPARRALRIQPIDTLKAM